MVGQGAKEKGSLYGRLSAVRVSDGALQWTQSYSVGGNPGMIYQECWGVVAMADSGFALACGAGIENCDPDDHPSSFSKADCEAGRGDMRKGAVPRHASMWQSYVVKTDAAGKLEWQRVDSWKDPAAASDDCAGSSSCEWLVATADGGLAAITDELMGVGLLKLGPARGQTAADLAAAAPAPSCSAAGPVWAYIVAAGVAVGVLVVGIGILLWKRPACCAKFCRWRKSQGADALEAPLQGLGDQN